MARVKKVDSKEVGLDIGLVLLKFFLKTDHLHYGLFSDGLEGDIANLKQAQENYTELLAGHIEDGVKTILDVGCGSGKTARTLLDRGYTVDCVAPGRILPKRVRELLGDESEIFTCRFQDLETDKRYDLILFSESFQYLPMNESVPGALAAAAAEAGGLTMRTPWNPVMRQVVVLLDARGIRDVRGTVRLDPARAADRLRDEGALLAALLMRADRILWSVSLVGGPARELALHFAGTELRLGLRRGAPVGVPTERLEPLRR